MKISSKITSPIEEEMKHFGPYYKKNFDTKIPLLNIITNYLIRRKGKQMRPMLVFLSAKLNGSTDEGTYTAAGLIELLHNATLIHDDVVDETYQRRGFFSINALWRSKIAVLVGDYYLAMGLIKSLEENQTEVLRIVSTAVKEMSEGELLQIEKSRKLNITEDIYYEIIRKKTATLIAACTAAGALSSGASEEQISKMRDFGEYLGIAFQIRDDLLDYEKTNLAGKPTGNDLKEKKMTLPLIHVLEKMPASKKRQILSTIRKHHKNEKKIAPIVQYVKDNGGINYAREKMTEYRDKALEILNSYPESDAREGLIELVHFTTTRKI
ncbi:polyprenyl synthetase family protein [Marinilabilia salmonicolor]|jgi:octaprenyl-diphosphate synthase|uniref:Octaprenyl-diphosphate synthase n=1 Tax=Marinilabilia salmonicolor TaxID=989 RepID=A0A2T0XSP9_9BACT|nr:polyprenyl synthetase family protein [Marinilabilia salmonicolor]PRZ01902.1 octaprenyl-diphosphate synthase [Marinilabilia salmonicolor]RCW32020.1 octaprenyl-diphosphate synthase [Marinilabilia salmonicolor]